MNIYLIGFMGSGKTSVGTKLSGRLKRKFIDLDVFIESGEGKSISTIFKESGEEQFRSMEAGYLRETGGLDNHIIACGGGTPCWGDNMEFMKLNGYTIYLQMTPAALYSRLKTSMDSRPLISGMKSEELIRYIEMKVDERRWWYEQAHYTTDGLDVDIDQIVTAILNQESGIL